MQFLPIFDHLLCSVVVLESRGETQAYEWTDGGGPADEILVSHIGYKKKSGMRETKNLSTDADSRTDTILERLRDLF